MQTIKPLGADCVLLVVAALDALRLRDFEAVAVELGLSVLGKCMTVASWTLPQRAPRH